MQFLAAIGALFVIILVTVAGIEIEMSRMPAMWTGYGDVLNFDHDTTSMH